MSNMIHRVKFLKHESAVNSVKKSYFFPLQSMDKGTEQVGSAKFVCKFDLPKGYWQVYPNLLWTFLPLLHHWLFTPIRLCCFDEQGSVQFTRLFCLS